MDDQENNTQGGNESSDDLLQGSQDSVSLDSQTHEQGDTAESQDDSFEGLFSLSEDDLTDQDEDSQESAEEDKGAESEAEDDAFSLADSTVPEHMHEGLAHLAKQAGIKGSVASDFIKSAIAHAATQDKKLLDEQAQELKEELGADFEPTIKATRQFMARMAKKAGLELEDMALLSSPRGFRLMNAMRVQMAEPNSIVGKASDGMSTDDKIEALLNNPDKFLALNDSTHPNHKRVNAELNALYGIKG